MKPLLRPALSFGIQSGDNKIDIESQFYGIRNHWNRCKISKSDIIDFLTTKYDIKNNLNYSIEIFDYENTELELVEWWVRLFIKISKYIICLILLILIIIE